jgi:hypothetical protein
MAYTPQQVVWESIFMLLVLKIPVVYLGLVVWWAIKAEPKPEEPALLVPVAPLPEPRPPVTYAWRAGRGDAGWRRSGRPPRRPAGGRSVAARAEARR